MKYRVDLVVLSEVDRVARFGLTLHNLSDQPLNDWQLHFAVDRFIQPTSLTQGKIHQVGSYCLLSPDPLTPLPANHHFYVEFEIFTAPFRFLSDGIDDAFLQADGERYEVDITPIVLASPYAERESVPDVAPAELAIIPKPAELKRTDGYFDFAQVTSVETDTDLALKACHWLSSELNQYTDANLELATRGEIEFAHNPTFDISEYRLCITSQGVKLEAGSSEGFLHAAATLLQIISGQQVSLLLPCVNVHDKPQYRYRGMMLDCARHFHSVEQVKQLINQLAQYKFNHFHWHLTDDEGWRIEIKSLPQLTQVGAWRGVGEALSPQYSHLNQRYGGYYTQEEVKDVIAYAKARGITVIAEIDIPGHCRAAIKALPELLVDAEDRSDYRSIQYYNDNILNPALEGTYTFLDKVLEEVAALFPAPYLHIGADEVPEGVWVDSPKCQAMMEKHGYTDPKELQGHLLRYAERKLKQLGKRMLGWEEAQHGNKVSKDTVIYSWLSEKAALECAKNGFDVVLQPGQTTYLDMTQDFAPEEPGVDWANPLPLEATYHYQPLQEIADNDPIRNRIWGVQCALWCELIHDQQRFEYMVNPRLSAIAEVCWTTKDNKDWLDYLSRLKSHLSHLQRQGIGFRSPWAK
ncbi:family 20 glycosylhydrolase [Vibrio sp. SCSIO 43136]|uniref:beta-N-acetylhexosaminidase n=1 Tax=Vibrio sp. SCSIO 43136 TaxID=2819101 RepID=UPI0020758F02|nr:family 20 glycosylhydrolase [Vibrio sp. SCSIO 43136]USD64803.1 beta-N-acetylhexosaminidase [Vibrio sp. SCSIO 43136]